MPSYEKNKSSGLWSVRFRETSPIDGTTHQKRLSGYKTKKDAQYGYEDYITEKSEREKREAELEREKSSPDNMRFETLTELFLEFKKTRLKDSSYYDLSMKIKDKILPFFAEKRLRDITPQTVLDWQNSLEDYSYEYRKSLNTKLSSIYVYGEKYHDIKNIMTKVDRPRNLEAKKEMLFWSPEEFSAFIKEVPKKEYEYLYRFLYITGCRRGEALALSWNEIDLKAGTVKIFKNAAYKVGKNGKPYDITTPKNTGSNRTVTIPRFFCDQLKEYREWQKERFPKTDFVFCGEDPLPPTSIERIMTKAAEKAGVKRIRVHDLRHSCTSLLIHKGVSIVAVSRRLGHTSIEQTLNTYSHMMPDDQTMILSTLETLSEI